MDPSVDDCVALEELCSWDEVDALELADVTLAWLVDSSVDVFVAV